jgi:hypothetical protein
MQYKNITGDKNMKIKSLNTNPFLHEGQFVVDDDNLYCFIGDKKVNLCYMINVTDIYEATGESKDYPFSFEISLMVKNPHKSFAEYEDASNNAPSRSERLSSCDNYMGGVPITHRFLDLDASNKNLLMELKAKTAKLITESPEYGTIAAQKGKDAKFTYPMFKDSKEALRFAGHLIKNYKDVINVMIGFCLDAPTNLAGHRGWSTIKQQLQGVK